MVAMSKRERVMRTVRQQETDRVPIYDILQNDGLIEYLAGQPLTVEEGERTKGRAIGRCLDMTRMPQGPHAPHIEKRDDGIVVRVERWTSWIVERPWRDRTTLVAWVHEQINRAERAIYGRAYADQWFAAMDRFQGYFGDDTVQVVESGTGLTEIYWALGWEDFAYLLVDEPGLIEAWLDANNRAQLRRVAAIADPRRIPIALTYDDIAYKTTLLVSPAWLRREWFPLLKKLNDAWHSRDVYCLFHSDGHLWAVLDDLIAAGIDGLNPLEVQAGMTVREVRQRYPQLFLTGGVDVSQLLPLGTPEEIRAVAAENIAATQRRGYFLGSTTELHWEIPTANILAMFETAWGHQLTKTGAALDGTGR
jgi:hypothetical protein